MFGAMVPGAEVITSTYYSSVLFLLALMYSFTLLHALISAIC
jgi:hypothetical protein